MKNNNPWEEGTKNFQGQTHRQSTKQPLGTNPASYAGGVFFQLQGAKGRNSCSLLIIFNIKFIIILQKNDGPRVSWYTSWVRYMALG